MASIDRRNGRWRARYRAPDGRSASKTFDKKIDAERHLTSVEHSKLVGAYVDPARGRIILEKYAEAWRTAQVQLRPSSAAIVEGNFRNHVYPVLGDRPLASIRPSEVQAFVAGLGLAPATVTVVFRYVSAVFKAAVADRLIAVSPCAGVKLPRIERPEVIPLEPVEVLALADAVPEQYRALVLFGAGTGVRQGEAFGLTPDRIDFLRRRVTIDRQLVTLHGGPRLAPPKTPSSVRAIPLPDVTLTALSGHLSAPVGVSGFVFTNERGAPLRRSNVSVWWRAAVKRAGLPEGTTFHALRHSYASLLIRHGESVKTVQARLGHASALETLSTYAHLWPDSDDRTRDAVDAAFLDALGTRVGHARTRNAENH